MQAGAVIQASFKLTIGQRTETVEVEGSAPLVELSPNNNNYVDNEKIENVPLNGRDFNSLLAITPGVQRTPGGGFQAISINGSKVDVEQLLHRRPLQQRPLLRRLGHRRDRHRRNSRRAVSSRSD